MDIDKDLTDSEGEFLIKVAKRRHFFLLSSIVTAVLAVSFMVYHTLFAKDLNGLRFAIIIILLLSGRTYLRLYKSAVIFNKLNAGKDKKSNDAV